MRGSFYPPASAEVEEQNLPEPLRALRVSA